MVFVLEETGIFQEVGGERMAWLQFAGGFPGEREKTVLSTTLSLVNLNFKLLFWLVYKMIYTCSSQCPATFPQAMLCYRTPNFNNHLPYVWTKYQGHWEKPTYPLTSMARKDLWIHTPLAHRLIPNWYWDNQSNWPLGLVEQSPHIENPCLPTWSSRSS